MINIKEISESIINEVKSYLGSSEVIFAEQKKKKPKYPFVTMKITSPYIAENGQGIITQDVVPSTNSNFEYDIEMTKAEMPKITISITTYSLDDIEAIELAMKCREWFNFKGYKFLDEKDLIVVDLSSIFNKDTLIVGDYERRQGFDVILRTTDETKLVIETIEEVDIRRE